MTETKERAKHLIATTARENEIIDDIPNLAEYGILPNNKTEIFCRGLHIVKHLAQSNETSLLRLLVDKLESVSLDLNKKEIDEIKSLADSIYSILIAKNGILGAEVFESIPTACRYLDLVEEEAIDKREVKKMLEDIATSIRTLILKESRSDKQIDLQKFLDTFVMRNSNIHSMIENSHITA